MPPKKSDPDLTPPPSGPPHIPAMRLPFSNRELETVIEALKIYEEVRPEPSVFRLPPDGCGFCVLRRWLEAEHCIRLIGPEKKPRGKSGAKSKKSR